MRGEGGQPLLLSRPFRKQLIPSAYAMRSRAAHARHLAAKPAFVPFGLIVSDERKFSGEHPPFTGKREIAALHVVQRDILPPADLANMLSQTRTQCPLAQE